VTRADASRPGGAAGRGGHHGSFQSFPSHRLRARQPPRTHPERSCSLGRAPLGSRRHTHRVDESLARHREQHLIRYRAVLARVAALTIPPASTRTTGSSAYRKRRPLNQGGPWSAGTIRRTSSVTRSVFCRS